MPIRPRTPFGPILALLLAITLEACQTPSGTTSQAPAPPAEPPVNAAAAADRPSPPPSPVRTPSDDLGEPYVPPDLNDARAAAKYIATQPPVADPATRREIDLESTLYQAAWETNVGQITHHFLLEPLPANEMPPLAISIREFRLRVLARMALLDGRFAWTTPMARNPVAREYFPHTGLLATRLRIRIDARTDAGAAVEGELSDWTAAVGSSRQRFTAAWNGAAWTIQRDRVRLIQ